MTSSTSTRTLSRSIQTLAQGVQNCGDIEFTVEYVSEGNFGSVPETIYEKAFHLLRLLGANHPFVDGNKRTALNPTSVFYLLNGRRFEYDDEIRVILKRPGTDETTVDEDHVLDYSERIRRRLI